MEYPLVQLTLGFVVRINVIKNNSKGFMGIRNLLWCGCDQRLVVGAVILVAATNLTLLFCFLYLVFFFTLITFLGLTFIRVFVF